MTYYDKMTAYEILGHVAAIPDASELSKALAERLRDALAQLDSMQAAAMNHADAIASRDKRIFALSADLENALDKVAGFMEATDPQHRLAM